MFLQRLGERRHWIFHRLDLPTSIRREKSWMSGFSLWILPGGVIYSQLGNLTVNASEIYDNKVSGNGGGIGNN